MKRILSMLLVICMVLSFMPRIATAQEADAVQLPQIGNDAQNILVEDEEAEDEKSEKTTLARVPDLSDADIPAIEKKNASMAAVNGYQTMASASIHYWISEEAYGDPTSGSQKQGIRYYFNYELYDADSGYLWDYVADNSYTVTLTVTDSYGDEVFSEPFYDHNGWVSLIFFTSDTYYFRLSISGDFNYSNGFNFSVVYDSSVFSNLAIHCDPTSLTMDPGDSTLVDVWTTGPFDGEYYSVHNNNSSVISVNWNSKISDEYYDLLVTAVAPGTATLTFTYLHNVTEASLATTSMTVTVSQSDSSTFTVSFEVEGGSGAPSAITAEAGSTITIPSNVPTFSTFGRAFTHWEAIDSMGNTISVYPGGTLAVIEDLEFLACWRDAEELDLYSLYGATTPMSLSDNIEFGGQYIYYCFYPGGSSSQPLTYEFKGTGTLDNRIYLYDSTGYLLASDDDGAGTNNQFKLTRTFSDNNLYFIKVQMYSSTRTGSLPFQIRCTTEYVGQTYTISFNAPDGSGAPASMTAQEGQTITIPSTVPTANTFGMAFGYWVGWNNGEIVGTAMPGDQVTVTSDIVYEALWYSPIEMDIYSLFGSTNPLSLNYIIRFSGDSIYYVFNPGGSEELPLTYRFEGVGAVDSQIYLYDSTGIQLAWNDDDGEANQFLLEYTFSDNEQYYIRVKMWSSNVGDLPFEVTCLTEATMATLSYADPYSSTVRTDEGTVNGTLTIVDEIPFHVGHTFLGWGNEDSDEVIWVPGDEITLTGDMTIYAKYQDAVPLPSTTTSIQELVNTIYMNGHYWFTYVPRVSTSYQFQDTSTTCDSSIVIYDTNENLLAENDDDGDVSQFRVTCQMSANSTYYIGVAMHDGLPFPNLLVDRGYRISYNANGGTNAPAQTYVYSQAGGYLSESVPTRDGYRFLGWATSASATTATYTAGEFVDIDNNTTLYAVWEEQTYECTHEFGAWNETVAPGCTTPGEEVRTCTLCGETETREIPALGHDYVDGECSRCHEEDPNPPATLDGVIRLAGSNRYATGFAIANQLKRNMGVEKFETVVVAYGLNFPDALTGSYLASVKNAPILLTDPSVDRDVLHYLQENLVPGGKVYILGGTSAVSDGFEVAAMSSGFNVTRLKGAGRYETNLEILKEAGVNQTDEILIATGKNYADSLSASATGLPMLLVDKTLTDSQKEFLQTTSKKFVILGGYTAVSTEVEEELGRIGTVKRLKGANRYATSVLIASQYFPNASAAVLAYAEGFPDGLCGGPLAISMGAPLILTSNNNYVFADKQIVNITSGAVTGGTSRISDETVREIFDLPADTPIPKP